MSEPTLDSLVALLAGAPALEPISRLDPGEEFTLDSLALTWLVHLIQESYGASGDPDDPRLAGVTTLAGILAYVQDAVAERAERRGT